MDVGELQRKLSQRATAEPQHRFGDLYALLTHRDWLAQAYQHIRSNTGSGTPGVDGETRRSFEANLDSNLESLRQELKARTFRPLPVRRVTITEQKADGRLKQRRLGIPALRDRIVQEGLRMILDPIYEADFSRHSYGFRKTRSTKDAATYLASRLGHRRSYTWAIEGDIRACFDEIRHGKLLRLLRRRIHDASLLQLLWRFLRAGCLEELTHHSTLAGVPQGGIVSCVLANVYLHELDRFMEQYTELSRSERQTRKRHGLPNFLYARYCDDFVVLCDGTKSQAHAMRQALAEFLATTLKLELSVEKTRITHVGAGFLFLGFQIERTIGQGGKPVPKVRIPDTALQRVSQKINRVLAPATCQDSVRTKILALNRIIRGWCQYYQSTSSPGVYFHRLNYRVFWQMAHWLGRKFKLSMPRVMCRFGQHNSFGTKTVRLLLPSEVPTQWYRLRPLPNPYLCPPAQRPMEQSILPEEVWTGTERRSGLADLRELVYTRDRGRCAWCGRWVAWQAFDLDHIKPRHTFTRPTDADVAANLQLLHKRPCHRQKTKQDRHAVAV
ncbi:MAG TPA: group II intron reverse transcriptase/maturase [Candidatus Binatia bacterium]|nr:group II intron reverse transcriptase/maturase [Candidatus Binatia bacterium]